MQYLVVVSLPDWIPFIQEIWKFQAENVSDSLLVKLRLYAPDVVFIHIGANDISKDSSCKTICENNINISDLSHEKGNNIQDKYYNIILTWLSNPN